MVQHRIEVPFADVWFFVACGILIVAALAVWRWRKRWLAVLSTICVILALIDIAIINISSDRLWQAEIARRTMDGSGIWHERSLNCVITAGSFYLAWEIDDNSPPLADQNGTKNVSIIGVINAPKFLDIQDRLSLIKSDFIRQRVRFDLSPQAILIPLWFPLVLFPWPPIAWYLRRRRNRRMRGFPVAGSTNESADAQTPST
jgi:hypothetical protein